MDWKVSLLADHLASIQLAPDKFKVEGATLNDLTSCDPKDFDVDNLSLVLLTKLRNVHISNVFLDAPEKIEE